MVLSECGNHISPFQAYAEVRSTVYHIPRNAQSRRFQGHLPGLLDFLCKGQQAAGKLFIFRKGIPENKVHLLPRLAEDF